jgi:hypothetical protein
MIADHRLTDGVYRDYSHAMSRWTGGVRRCSIDRAAGRQFVFRYEWRDTPFCDERSSNDDTARRWQPVGAT